MQSLPRILSGLLVLTLGVPAFAQVTDQDIDEARREVNRIVADSAELGEAVIAGYARQEELDAEIDRLRTSIELAGLRIADTEERLEELAVELYMGSTTGVSLSMLFSSSDEGYPAGMEYLRRASGVDENLVDQLRTLRSELDRQTGSLGAALNEQETVTAELEAMSAELQEDLIAAQQVYDTLVAQKAAEDEARRQAEEARRQAEEEARRAAEAAARTTTTQAPTQATTAPSPATTAPPTTSPPTTSPPATTPPPPSGSGACPVAGAVSFSDTWGAPRSGGRTHKGVDMIAARGVPIVAIYSGRVQRLSNSSLGGLSVYFVSDAGDLYYYAHLDAFGDIRAGQQVPVGYVLGYNGSSGNAPSYLPHLHFEYHPGGGSAVNPYPLVKSLCG